MSTRYDTHPWLRPPDLPDLTPDQLKAAARRGIEIACYLIRQWYSRPRSDARAEPFRVVLAKTALTELGVFKAWEKELLEHM